MIDYFASLGYRVILVAPLNTEVTSLGPNVHFLPVQLNRSGKNPVNELKYFKVLKNIYKKEKPDYIFHYMIKPNIYGTIAAKWCGIPSTVMIAGLGYVFNGGGLGNFIARQFYKFALRFTDNVFVLNAGNKTLLRERNMVSLSKVILLKGVDPYYLAQCAQRYGYNPEIILAGRRTNDSMGEYVANQVIKLMLKKGIQVLNSRILILGFTFKENCPDVRNTKVIDIINALNEYNLNITTYDPWVNPDTVKKEYGIEITNQIPEDKYDAIILAVAHEKFNGIILDPMMNPDHVVYDVKGVIAVH